jgi:hypothetical protein
VTSLYVLTAPRAVDYLSTTLAALSAQAWRGPRTVWSDGPISGDVPPGWRVVERPRRGPPNTHAFRELLEDARAVGGDILVVEDDVAPSPGFLPYVERVGCPAALAFVSWFDPICRVPASAPAVVFVPAAHVLPAQARTWPASSVEALCRASDAGAAGGLDAWAAGALRGGVAAVHVPSLVQHVGMASAASSAILSPARQAESWMGRHVDVDHVFAAVTAETLWGVLPWWRQ